MTIKCFCVLSCHLSTSGAFICCPCVRTNSLFLLFLWLKGTYNPIPNSAGNKEIRLKTDRLKYWVSVGAQPSDRVAWILGK